MFKLTITEDNLKQGIINSPTADPICKAILAKGGKDPHITHGGKRVRFTDSTGSLFEGFLPLGLYDYRKRLEYEDRFQMPFGDRATFEIGTRPLDEAV